jgi:hypothetical protein
MLVSSSVWAAGPLLTGAATFPTEGQPGEPKVFHVIYTNPSGDPATTMEMIVETPAGESKIPGTQPVGTDPGQGITYTFTFTPQNTGTYKYHFHAESSTGQSADTPEYQYTSYSLTTKYIILVIGLIVALLFLPFIVYVVARAANKHGNPATAARFGLLVGVLASYFLFLYLFFTIYSVLTLALAGIAAVALLIALFTRR